MTSIEFDFMDFAARAIYLLRAGVYIADRTSYNHRISLRSVSDFYAEVHFEPDEENVVSRVESVQDVKLLALYVPDTELENLF